MLRRAPALVLFVLLVLFTIAATPGSAGASCIGPTVQHDGGEVRPGDTVVITGIAWGDACHDTGPPPEGQGVLGHPQTNIDIILVQGDVEILVANGDADENYEFSVTITIPSELAPGKFGVLAQNRHVQGFVDFPAALVLISGDDTVPVSVAEFDPSETDNSEVDPLEPEAAGESADGPADEAPNGSRTAWLMAGGGGAVAALGALGVGLARRR